MSEVSITIDSNLAEVLKSYEDLPQGIRNALTAGLRLGMEAIRGGVQRHITTTFRTTSQNGLRQSINVKVEGVAGDNLQGTISADQKYAAIQEFGTVGKGGLFPDIVPVKAKALRFEMPFATRIAPKSGVYRRLAKPQEISKVIFCKRVSLPARPFFYPAIEENLHEVPDQMRDQVDSYLEGKKV